jgi:hypothetical protein
MKRSNLLTVAITVALLFANPACACAASDRDAEAVVHHHAAGLDSGHDAPCRHQDCQGCDQIVDRCSTPEYCLTCGDRSTHLPAPPQADPDGPDLHLATLDTGQTWSASKVPNEPLPLATSDLRATDTPIRRRDQLTE